MTRARRWVVLLGGLAAVVGWYFWNVSPRVIEARMLEKSATFLDAIEMGDRLTVLKMTTSEKEELDALNSSRVIATGVIKVEPGLLSPEQSEGKSFWDPAVLKVLGKHARSPSSYSLNTDPDTPSIVLNFDCPKSGECLEHVMIFFTSRAGKISGYIMFWNTGSWQKLWKEFYAEGLITKPCDDSCPF